MIDFDKFVQSYFAGMLEKKDEDSYWFKDSYGANLAIKIVDLDKKQFKATMYYDSGSICYEENFSNGMPDGRTRGWYIDGTVRWDGEYVNGEYKRKVDSFL